VRLRQAVFEAFRVQLKCVVRHLAAIVTYLSMGKALVGVHPEIGKFGRDQGARKNDKSANDLISGAMRFKLGHFGTRNPSC
jgi:hypothetical protein